MKDSATCSPVTIKGANFSDNIEDLEIYFGDIQIRPEDIFTATTTAIICYIPPGVHGEKEIIVKTDDRSDTIEVDKTFVLGAEIIDTYDTAFIAHIPGISNKITLEVTLQNNCSADTPDLHYRGITEEGGWQTRVMNNKGEESSYKIELSDAYFTDPVGINYFYSIHDISDTVIYSDTAQVLRKYLGIDSLNNISNFVEYFGENATDYRLVSIPFTFESNKVREVFADLYILYGADSIQWRIFEYDADRQKFRDVMHGDGLVEPGKCFALLSRHEVDLNLKEGTTVAADQSGFEIVLKPGWNLVGNPYPFVISWSEVMQFNGNPEEISSAKGLEDGWEDNYALLKKFSGLAVHNKTSQDYSIFIPCKPSSSSNCLAWDISDGYIWKTAMTLKETPTAIIAL